MSYDCYLLYLVPLFGALFMSNTWSRTRLFAEYNYIVHQLLSMERHPYERDSEQQKRHQQQSKPPSLSFLNENMQQAYEGYNSSSKPASAPPLGPPPYFYQQSLSQEQQRPQTIQLQSAPHPLKKPGEQPSLPPNHPLAGLPSVHALQQQQYQASRLHFYHTRPPVYVPRPSFGLKDFELLDTLGSTSSLNTPRDKTETDRK